MARVIYNRLEGDETNGLLQIDASVNYGLAPGAGGRPDHRAARAGLAVQHLHATRAAAHADRGARRRGDRGGREPDRGRLVLLRDHQPADRRDQVRVDVRRVPRLQGASSRSTARPPTPAERDAAMTEVDRGGPMRCAVLGDPIAHSLSPALHRAGYAAAGLDWEYDAAASGSPTGSPAFLDGLDGGWRGLSLTMPLKRTALGLADRLRPGRRVGPPGRGGQHARARGRPGRARRQHRPARCRGGRPRAVRRPGDRRHRARRRRDRGLHRAGAVRARRPQRDAPGASPERAAEAAWPRSPVTRPRPRVEVGSLAGDPIVGEVVVSTIPAEAQDAALVARCGSTPVVFEVLYDPWPTPLAASAAAGQGPARCWWAAGPARPPGGAAVRAVHRRPGPLSAMRAAGEAALASRRAAR